MKEKKAKETKYIAKVKLLLNRGHLKAEPGDVIFLGERDIEDGLNIDNLVSNQGIVLYESQKQADLIKREWETTGRARRESIRSDTLKEAKRRQR